MMKRRCLWGALMLLLVCGPGRGWCQDAAPGSFDRGLRLMESGRYADAIEAFSSSLGAGQADSRIYNNRGIAWFYLENYARAIADYDRALDLDPSYDKAWCNRGTARLSQGDFEGGVADCRRALEINSDYAEAYHQLGLAFALFPDRKRRDPALGVRYAQKAAALKEDVIFLDALAAAYDAAGKPKAAVETQQTVIARLTSEGREGHALQPYAERLEHYRRHLELKIRERSRPYTIQVGSFRDRGRADHLIRDLENRGDAVFTSRARLSEKGIWQRVFVGHYQNYYAAKRAAIGLKRRKFKHYQVVKMPLAVEVASHQDAESMAAVEEALRRRGWLAYRMADPAGEAQERLLVGAFQRKDQARELLERLRAAGFKARLATR